MEIMFQKICEKPQVVTEYEAGRGIPNQQVLAKMERALGKESCLNNELSLKNYGNVAGVLNVDFCLFFRNKASWQG